MKAIYLGDGTLYDIYSTKSKQQNIYELLVKKMTQYDTNLGS